MTPPGDGGPGLLPCPWGHEAEVIADHAGDTEVVEYRAQCSVSIQCPTMARTSWLPTRAEATAAWNRRPSTRDAALREEGRVQERDALGQELGRRISATFGGPDDGTEQALMNLLGWLMKRASQPDASQGSAPVLATPDAIEAVARALWDDNAAYETENVPGVRPLPAWEEGDLVGKREARRAATAALTALRAHLDKENARG